MKLRRAVIATHRDLGFLLCALTVIYAISGIAVNHIDDWNPSYVVRRTTVDIGPVDAANTQLAAGAVLERMAVDAEPNAVVRTAPERVEIFFDGRTVSADLADGRVVDERTRRRFVLFEMNYLHLNRGKGVWTWIADLYAVGLLILASTGLFIITGRKGLTGRGGKLVLVGLAIPLVYLVVVL